MTKEQEIWKTTSVDERYEVSNYGNVRRKGKKANLAKIRMNTGYYCVHIGEKMRLLHRIVAEAFCLNGGGYDKINHIDEDKSNNTAWNLEWCDMRWNNNWGSKIERSRDRVLKAVEKYDLEGNYVCTYGNASLAVRDVQGDVHSTLILMCCKGRRATAYGYRWRYSMKDPYTHPALETAEA